jgi:hypothetical protein
VPVNRRPLQLGAKVPRGVIAKFVIAVVWKASVEEQCQPREASLCPYTSPGFSQLHSPLSKRNEVNA